MNFMGCNLIVPGKRFQSIDLEIEERRGKGASKDKSLLYLIRRDLRDGTLLNFILVGRWFRIYRRFGDYFEILLGRVYLVSFWFRYAICLSGEETTE